VGLAKQVRTCLTSAACERRTSGGTSRISRADICTPLHLSVHVYASLPVPRSQRRLPVRELTPVHNRLRLVQSGTRQDPVADRGLDSFHTRGGSKLGVNVRKVSFDGGLADKELASNLAIALGGRDER
jgi:hypothetical protein